MQQAAPQIKDDVSAIDRSLLKARKTFQSGITRPLAYRLKQLQNLKQGCLSMANDLSDALNKDLGRTAFVSWFTELSVIDHEIQHTMDNLKKWANDESVDTPMLIGPGKSKIVYEPLGVVLVMGSWNFPLYTTLGPLIHVIAAGNTALIKPSEMSPFVSNTLKKLINRSLDMNAYVCIEGQVEVAKSLTTKKFDCICFTGSSEKGKLVAAAAGKNLIPCILELGGKSPVVIDESADADFAAKKVCLGRFINSGQTCIAPDFALVHHTKLQKFIESMKKYVKEFWQDGKNEGEIGKIINDFHKNRICEYLKDHKGSVVIGNANAHEDKNLTPTVILSPAKDSAVMTEEIFGPVLPVFTYSDFDEVIKTINDGEKPLALYYFGKQTSKNFQRLEKETSSGALVTNETLFQMLNSDLPFGGVGYSGYGRYHGKAGFQAFSNPKSVLVKPVLDFYPYNRTYPPYTNDKQKLIKNLTKYLSTPQSVIVKRLVLIIIFINILRGIIRGSINAGVIKKRIGMIFQILKLLIGR